MKAEETSSNSICVHWKASTRDAGSSLWGYVVEYQQVGHGWCTLDAYVGFHREVNNLLPSTSYNVRVSAVNFAGDPHISAIAPVQTGPPGMAYGKFIDRS